MKIVPHTLLVPLCSLKPRGLWGIRSAVAAWWQRPRDHGFSSKKERKYPGIEMTRPRCLRCGTEERQWTRSDWERKDSHGNPTAVLPR